MKDIVTRIVEGRKEESMLQDICQMWSDIPYDVEYLKDKKKLDAIKKFHDWASSQDEDDIQGSPELSEFEKAINESVEIDESKADTLEKKIKTALKKAIDSIE